MLHFDELPSKDLMLYFSGSAGNDLYLQLGELAIPDLLPALVYWLAMTLSSDLIGNWPVKIML